MFSLPGEGLLAPDSVMGGGAEDDTHAMFAFLDQDGDGFVDPQDWVDGLCGVDSNTELAGVTHRLLHPRVRAPPLCCPCKRMCEQASAMAE
jgi:hypothetical protein